MAKKVEIQNIYPCTPMQEGMLFHTLLDQESYVYFEQTSFTISGTVEVALLEQSFNHLIKRYDILRTNFIHHKSRKPQQVVLKERSISVHYEDYTHLDVKEQEVSLHRFKEADKGKGFELSRDLLMRVSVIRTGIERYVILWSHHHILMDGWCLGIILQELMQIYTALKQGTSVQLGKVQPYLYYINWLKQQDQELARQFWSEYLGGFEELTSIPKQISQGQTSSRRFIQDELAFKLPESITLELRKFAQQHQVTLNTVVQAVWGVLLQHYNHSSDVVFGSVVSGRPSEINGIEKMVGLFINTVPVRVQGRKQAFSQLVKDMQNIALQAERFDYFPLYDIQNGSALKQNLVDHIIAFENYPIQEQIQQSQSSNELGFRIEDADVFEQSNYDFTLAIGSGKELFFKISFNTAVYERSFIQQIGGHVQQIIKTILGQPDIRIDEIAIVTEEEEAVLRGFHTASLDGGLGSYPRNKLLPELFAEQVALRPDALAVVQGERSFTYRELQEESDWLAQRLIQQGVQRGERVGLMAGRSADMVVGMLGIVKAGGAYLPLEAGLPEERKQYMLQDGGVRWIVVSEELRQNVPAGAVALVLGTKEEKSGDSRGEDRGATLGASDVQASLSTSEAVAESAAGIAGERISKDSAEQVAYVMYTSGSTGTPKGVMVTHRNVVRLVKQSNYVQLEAGDRLLQTGASGFDANTFEVWGTLLNGLTVYFVEDDILLEAERLGEALQAYQISTMWLTSPLFNQLAQQKPSIFQGMKQLLVGGDVLSPVHIEQVRQACPSLTVINGYGPTENTTFSVCYRVEPGERIEGAIPIGYPISHSSAYILNEQQQLKPIGVAGELCVGGDGVALGYLNQAPLTKERFVPDPFLPEGRMYRTGDLARWLPDGRIEYLGRMDQQVKLRGYRVETGEVESQLLKLAGVRDAVVLVREHGGEKQLCAYYVADQDLDGAELKAELKAKLPDYMIPTLMMSMEKLPLTANGKIDRAQLPEPDRTQLAWSEEPPAGEVEKRLAQLWQDVLGVERVGRGDHFFEMGGHSLKATQLLTRIHKEFQVEVPLKQIFEAASLVDMASAISSAQEATYTSIPLAEPKTYYPVSSAQKRMMILDQLEDVHTAYNIPTAVMIKGELDIERVEDTFKQLIKRHDSLRTTFMFVNDAPVQKIESEFQFQLKRIEAKEADLSYVIQEFIQPFDLSKAPLFRAMLVKLGEQEYSLVFDMHHIISDGTSMNVFMKEFIQLYEGATLLPIKRQYKDYAVWQDELLSSERAQEQERYWLEQFKEEIPTLDLPLDDSRPTRFSFNGNRISFELDTNTYQGLKQINRTHGTTLFMGLLAAYYVLLSKLSLQEDIIVGSPIAGRNHAELDSIIGVFINTLALRNYPVKQKTFGDFLLEVKDNTLQAFENQDMPFERLVELLELRRDISRNALFDTMFILQNMEMEAGTFSSFSISQLPFENPITKYDLTLSAVEQSNTVVFSFEYCTDLFTEETIHRFAHCYQNILNQIIQNPALPIAEINMLTDQESKNLVSQFNPEPIGFPEQAIHVLFEEQVRQRPTQEAIRFGQQSLTYQELNDKANQIAHALRARGVQREELVGI
ncbi:non-ribosomal peptide synthetase, partial [Bacillus horti]